MQIGGLAVFSICGSGLLSSCASQGTEPHAMTASGHEAAARSEEQAGTQHAARFDPKATDRSGPSPTTYAGCTTFASSNCYIPWASTQNPTERHSEEAARHRKVAEQHRAASQALREAEQRFCSGIPPEDRDASPFSHREDITVVGTLKSEPEPYDGLGRTSPNGARVAFRAVPGLTGQWLQRVVDCHLARNAVMGAADPTMSYCPLAVPHATASVVSTRDGFAVDITSDDSDSVREIVKRAQALKSGA